MIIKHMKTNLLKLTCGLALLGAVATAPAQSTVNMFLTDDGSGNTTVSWTASGDIVGSGMIVAMPTISGTSGIFGGTFTNYFNASALSTIAWAVSGGGIASDPTGANHFIANTSCTIVGVEFRNIGGGMEAPPPEIIQAA
jgi:hypothetical protein